MKRSKRCGLLLFLIGGVAYLIVELCWRKRTHISMFFVGGLCFRLIGGVYTKFAARRLWLRCVISALAVTVVEFFSGCYLNLYLKCGVWDYTNKRCNLLGQVCLLYTFLWGLLSIPAGILYRYSSRLFSRRAESGKWTAIALR